MDVSHRTHAYDRDGRQKQQRGQASRPSRPNATVPQTSQTLASTSNKPSVAWQRLSTSSSVSGHRLSSGSTEDTSTAVSRRLRPSALPRSAATQANASTRPYPGSAAQGQFKTRGSEPLHSANDVRTQPQPTLRRKHPSVGAPSSKSSGDSPKTSFDTDTDSLLGFPYERQYTTRPSVAAPNMYARSQQQVELPPDLIPELQALAVTHARPSTVQGYSVSSISSPSTQYTESPEPWSSRNTTPMSVPSYSPAIVQPLRINQSGKRANTVPLPTNPRIRATRLPVLQETLTSSSSSEAGRDHTTTNTQQEAVSTPKRQKKPRIENMEAPTPPPRSASAKRNNIAEVLDSGIGHARDPDSRRNQNSNNVENSPLARRSSGALDVMGDLPPSRIIPTTRDEAADSQSKPTRPSRSQIISLEPRHPVYLQPKPDTHDLQSRRGEQTLQSSDKRDISAPELPSKQPGRSTAKGTQQSSYMLSVSAPASRLPQREKPPPYVSPTDSQPSQAEALVPARARTPGKLARLGAFIRGRKTPEPDLSKIAPRKLQRKGPVAGTGHEGYGKYAKHSKKFSLSSGTVDSQRSGSTLEREQSRPGSAKTSTSTRRDSKIRTSQSDVEEFVASRLKPVHIIGGSKKPPGHQQNTWSTSESENRSILAPSHSQQPSTDSFAPVGDETARGLLIEGTGAPPDFAQSPRLIQRQRARRFDFDDSPEMTAPAHFQGSLPYLQRTETSQSSVSIATSQASIPAYSRPLQVAEESLLKKQDKKGRKLKWNIFSRNHSSSKTVAQARIPPFDPSPEMPVRISAIPVPRSIPYYAMIESESENNISDLGGYQEQAAWSPPRPYTEESWMPPQQETYRPPSTLLPSLPIFSNQSEDDFRQPQSELESRQETQTAPPSTERPSEGRPRRLAQVGRIPRVVSRKDRRHTPNAHSFSRPFQPGNQGSPQLDVDTEVERPHLQIHTELLPARPFTEIDSSKPASAPAQMLSSTRDLGITLRHEYMAPIERQASQISTSTSSEGKAYVAAPVDTMRPSAQRPPSRYHGEDEVWNEYDDFIDHVMSPSKSKRKGKESERDTPEQAASSSPVVPPQRLQDRAYNPSAEAREASVTTQTPAIVFPAAPVDEARLSIDNRLRRSRIISALHSSIDPSSPFSVSRFFAGYGDSDKSSAERLSVSPQGAAAFVSASSHLAAPNRSSADSTSQPEVVVFDVAEKERDPAADNELHYASLMISRWLSFGRVLFSPAQDEVFNNPDRHILVLDGLRNEDFSYYCCVTFKRAYVHSLKEAEPRRRRPSDSGHAPPNFRTAEVPSFGEKFPFPPSFFSVVVLRFLPAMSDRTLQNLITEAKRILTPGGHLELMLLDLDIVNMGTNTRRAIREMKIRITNNDSGISLKPISDNIQGILGRKGFANLNRCVVGVPVAGKIAGSMDSSSSSHSSGGSYAQQNRFSQGSQKAAAHRAANPHIGENFSLNDLISDHTPGSDEKIAKIVSKTARFWFSHCYEPQVSRGGKTSRGIFSDRKVLNECKMRVSSFKLLIAHTQKPSELKRRTVSEPMLPTLATAGARSGRRNMS